MFVSHSPEPCRPRETTKTRRGLSTHPFLLCSRTVWLNRLWPHSHLAVRFIPSPGPSLPVPGRPMMICLRGAGWGDSAGSMSGSRAVGVGWQATGCGSGPPEASWCPSGFLSLSRPPEPDNDRTEPDELGIDAGAEGLDRAAWPPVVGVKDWRRIKQFFFSICSETHSNNKVYILFENNIQLKISLGRFQYLVCKLLSLNHFCTVDAFVN